MRRPRERLHFGFLLASIALALALWLHLKSEAALRFPLKADFTLRHTGLDESRYIIKTLPETVPVQVEGTAEELERFKAVKPVSLIATVDLSDARPEVSMYRVRLPRNEVIDRTGVTFRLLTDEVAVVIDEVVERDIDVTVDHYNVPPGLMFASADANPDKVRIRGPMGDIAKVAQVRALVDVSQAIGKGISVRLEPQDRSGALLESVSCMPPFATITPQLAKVPPTKNLLVSVVLVPGSVPAAGFRLTEVAVTPTMVKVSGDMNVLASSRAIETIPVRVDGLSASTVVRARLVVPRGLSVDRTSVDVRLRIEPNPVVGNPGTPPSSGGAP